MSKTKHILFWSEYNSNMTYDIFINKEITLSPFHKLALKSHEKLNTDVVLFTYQKIKTKLPKNIKVMDAGSIFPIKVAYNVLKEGHSIAHISDCVRLKYASKVNGVVLDMDAVLLKNLPSDFGWFASMPAKRTGGFAPKWGKAHPPIYVADKSWDGKALFNFPLKVSNEISKNIESLSHKIMHTLLEPPKKGSKSWNFVIWNVKKIIKYDQNAKVYQPIYFHPLPAWLGKNKCYSLESPTRLNGKTELFGYILPNIKKIFNKSYIIHHFFESTFNKSETVNDNFWANIPNDCLVAEEAKHILGNNWRTILLND